MSDLFGEPLTIEPPELAEQPKRKYTPKGYAAQPGTGPEGETCKTCAFKVRVDYYPQHYNKCELRRANWTHSYGTDIKVSAAACRFWKALEAK